MTPEEIKAARKRLGLTQAQFAERLRTRQATVSSWESGKHPIRRHFIGAIRMLLEPDKWSNKGAIIHLRPKEPEINLNGWLTVKAAAAKWKVTTKQISNWIASNKITSRTYPELNGLRLVPGLESLERYEPQSNEKL